MTLDKRQLDRANEIQNEIKELDNFLFYAEKVWTGKIIKRTSALVLKSNAFGAFDEAEYELDTEIKNKILDVLRNHLEELQKELESM